MKRKTRWMKTTLVAGLVLATAMGGTTAAFAKGGPGHGRGDDRGEGHGPKFVNAHQIRLSFSDMDGSQWNWVMQNIARLASQGVFQGYTDGTFRPNQVATRLDTIVAAVRLLGLESQATSSAEMNAHLNFKDANVIEKQYPQAVGYVDVAAKNGLFPESETEIQPNKPADRLWATTILVKAMKLDDQAKADMDVQLPFRDAYKIPAGSVGYVAVALDQKLIYGYNDNTFRPEKPITRAELAALLDRVGMKLPTYSNDAIQGTVTAAVSNNQLTIAESNGQTDQLSVDPNVFVFKNGQRIPLSDLQVGDQVTVRTNNNVVVFIEVDAPAQQNASFTGTIQSVSGNNVTVAHDGTTNTYALASNALIYRDGTTASASSLQNGDQAFIRLSNNQIILLQVTQPVQSQTTSFTGTIQGVSGNTVVIAKNNSDGSTTSVSEALASDAVIWRGGQIVSASSLATGDTVFVESVNNQIVYLQVTNSTTSANTTLNGTVKAAVSNNNLTVTQNGTDYTYALASNAAVIRDGQATTASALQPGDTVTATVVNNQYVVVNVTKDANQSLNLNGTISAVDATNGTVTINVNNTNSTYQVGGNTMIFRNGVRVNVSNLKVGDEVSVLLQSGTNQIVLLQVTKPVEDTNQQFTVDGLYQSVTLNSNGQIATITVSQEVYNGQQSTIYNVAPNVTITGDPTKLVQNHQVELKGQNQLVNQIIIQ